MRIDLIAVGTRMPSWVEAGYQEYARRMPPQCRLRLVEIPAGQRGRHADIARALREEGRKMLAAVPKGSRIVALDVEGKAWSTPQLARQLDGWMQGGRNIAILVGGPEGFDPACLAAAEQRWSLSPLTFPHPLVRIIVAEQLYRAHSLLQGHPYHRE